MPATGSSSPLPLGSTLPAIKRPRPHAAMFVVAAGLLLAALVVVASGGTAGAKHASAGAAAARQRAISAYGQLPLRFEANRGQTDPRVDFTARGAGYTLFLTPREAVLSLVRGSGHQRAGSVLRMRLLGAEAHPRVQSIDRLSGTTNYLKGRDASTWHTHAAGYGRVRYGGVYPGVDLLYHGRQGRLEYDFTVAPGADPARIALGFAGARRLTLDRSGALVAATAAGVVREHRPVLYQQIAGRRHPVSGAYALRRGHRVGFRVGRYDHSRPLVIDPELAYSTYLGGALGPSGDHGRGVAVDSAGDLYVAGNATSSDFPTTAGSYQPKLARNPQNPYYGDAFVTKFNPAGDGLIYSTFVGGSGDDTALALALDGSGRAYITGVTGSTDYPTTGGAYGTSKSTGFQDAFVSVLNASGTGLDYSTYLGSSGYNGTRGIAVDSSGKAYVTGSTSVADFPTKAPTGAVPFQGTLPGSSSAFVAKLDPAASGPDSLVYSTYLGGSSDDSTSGIAVDGAGSAYVTGNAGSSDFPTKNPYQAGLKGPSDAFVSKLSPDGSALVYSTYLGGAAGDGSNAIALDSAGRAFVTGATGSGDYPTRNPFQADVSGDPATDNTTDAFVTELDSAGSDLVYSSYLGGRLSDQGNGIAVDGSGAAYVVGSADCCYAQGGSFPTVDPVATAAAGSEAFVAEVRPGGGALEYSTYLGGGAGDEGLAVAIDGAGSAYVTGSTYSANLPTRNPFQAVAPSQGIVDYTDAFVAKLAPTGSRPIVSGLSRRSGPAGTPVALTGHGFAGASAVRFGGVEAAFSVVSDSQITATAPAHDGGPAAVTVTTAQGTAPVNPISTFTYAEGTWDLTGAAAAPRRNGYETVTALSDGRVLMAGGTGLVNGNFVTYPEAELYDPASGRWTPTGSMHSGREEHTATLLSDGRVLVAGGYDPDGNVLSSTELYDPASGTWSDSTTCGAPSASCPAAMATRRADAAATALADGRVLVVGGQNNDNFNGLASAEIFDPASGKWVSAGTMAGAREHQYFSATLLGGSPCATSPRPAYCGKVLVVGGNQPSAELYDPVRKSWTATGSLVKGLYGGHTATLLPDGQVLIAGGFNGGATFRSAELYDPASGTFNVTASMQTQRKFAMAALLDNGKVLVAGGREGYSDDNSAELYDPAAARWSPAGVMDQYWSFGQAVKLANGQVLINGSFNFAPSNLELYTPEPPTASAPSPGATAPGPSGPAADEKASAPGDSGAAADRIAPVVTGFGLTNNPFAVGGRPTPTSVVAAALRHKQGTAFRYRLSEAAKVRIFISRRGAGRRRGTRCVAPSPALRHAARCSRVVGEGTLARAGRQGANRVAFSGRLGSRALRPGRHQAGLIATDAAKNTSRPHTISFTIVRR